MNVLLIPTYEEADFPSELQKFFEERALICNPEVLTNERARVRMWARLLTLSSLNEIFWTLQNWPTFYGSDIENIWSWRNDKLKEELPDVNILKEMFSEEKLFDIQDKEDVIKEAVTYHLIEVEEKFLTKTLFSELKQFEIERLFCYDLALERARDEEEVFHRKWLMESKWKAPFEEDQENDEDDIEEFDLQAAIDEEIRNLIGHTSRMWIEDRFVLNF